MKYIYAFLLIILSGYSFAEISAPSAMQWGQSQSDLKRSGLSFSNCKEALNGDIEYCEAKGHDKPISFAETYYVYFIKGYGLHKVLVTGKDISSDLYGSDGKASYSKVKNSLQKKYPESDGYEYFSCESIGNKLYNESDEFYQCLNYEGCGMWYMGIMGANDVDLGSFSLQLKGSSRGTGYISLTYESPNWGEYLDAVKNKEYARDDEAF